MNKKLLGVLGLLPLLAGGALAANILFVSDCTTDSVNIPAVLLGDAHEVTVVTNDYNTGNTALQADLSGYDAVYWSATGTGDGNEHTNPAVFANLLNYVDSGGRVFVTGYDTLASPDDISLLNFIGGTAASDEGEPSGPCINEANALTTGWVDIRGIQPTGGYGDQDTVSGSGLMSDTVGVCPNDDGWVWTLRTYGNGLIAYVSNGNYEENGGEVDSWLDTTPPPSGAGCYNAALRNFAPAPSPAARGMVFEVAATEVAGLPLALFRFRPTVFLTCNDPLTGGARSFLAPRLTPVSRLLWPAVVRFRLMPRIKFCNFNQLWAANRDGISAFEWLPLNQPESVPARLQLSSLEAARQTVAAFALMPPVIEGMDIGFGASVTAPSSVTQTTIPAIVYGGWFGNDKLKAYLEYTDEVPANAQTGEFGPTIKRQQLSVSYLSVSYLAKLTGPKTSGLKASVKASMDLFASHFMDEETGESVAVIELPLIPKGNPNGILVLYNKYGMAAYPFDR